MLTYNCGEIVPGCDREFRGLEATAMVERGAEHAASDHGMAAADYMSKAQGLVRPL